MAAAAAAGFITEGFGPAAGPTLVPIFAMGMETGGAGGAQGDSGREFSAFLSNEKEGEVLTSLEPCLGG